MTQEELNLRISPTANKYLLIFPNERLLELCKRKLKRDDVIYMTVQEIEHNYLVGLRYINWNYIDEDEVKHMIGE